MKDSIPIDKIINKYKKGEISMGQAAEECSMNIKEFLELLAARKIDVFLVDLNDLEIELNKNSNNE